MRKSRIQLSDHFTFRRLIRFALPSIGMMVFTSLYCVVDGFFLSNFTPDISHFTGVNLIYPFIVIFGSFGFLFGTGGSALIGKKLGEGDKDAANKLFSTLIFINVAVTLLLTLIGQLALEPMIEALNPQQKTAEAALRYGRIYLGGIVFFSLQMFFHSLCTTAEKPKLGLIATLAAGGLNMGLDALFIAGFGWGEVGASAATVIGEMAGALIPLIYFARKNDSLLRLGKPSISLRELGKVCVNGSSEFVSQISMNLVGVLYNYQLLKYGGDDAVAIYGVIMYVGFIFVAIFIGYSMGTAPVVSYHLGAKNKKEIKGILGKSLVLIALTSVAMFIASMSCSRLISTLYLSSEPGLIDACTRAFLIYSFTFLACGCGIYISAFFTALNDGVTSAIISFLRTIVLQVAAVFVLPLFWGLDGIWSSVVFAEAIATLVAFVCLILKRKRFGYFDKYELEVQK